MNDWETKSFLNDPNLTTITNGVYVYKNFISKEQVERVNAKVKQKILEIRAENNGELDLMREKMIGDIDELFDVWEQMSKFLYPTHAIHPKDSVSVIRPGDGGMRVHEDSPGEGNHHKLSVTDAWNTCTILDYGVITYFGDYTGGAVFYPELGIEVLPEPGDMVIHGALRQHRHGVKEVDSGERYAFSNFSLPYSKNPGTFYTFNSDKYNEIRATDPNYRITLGMNLKPETANIPKNPIHPLHNYINVDIEDEHE